MTKFLKYQQDLEDSFRLDCNEEDIKTDKEAKRCYKVLKRYRKRTNDYYNYLCRNDMTSGRYTMKNNKNSIIGCILIIGAIVGILCCAVASTIFYFQNPDMTELRRFIEYPAPSIISIVCMVFLYVGGWLLKK